MKNTTKNQKGFAILESLLILVIIAVVGGIGWYTLHAKHQTDKILSQADKISQNTPIASTKSKPQNTSTNSSPKYLAISELGIKIPLTSDISDLGYVWQAKGGYSNYPIAVLGSTQLAKDFEVADPSECTAAKFGSVNGLYPLADIYTTEWRVGGSGGQKEVKSVTVKGKTYYLYDMGSGAGCDFSPNANLENEVSAYYNSVLNNFTLSASIK